MGTKYYDSAIGPLVHPWVNSPDVKFNADGLWHTGLRLKGKDAEDLAAKLDGEAQAAFEEYTKDMTPKDKKSWGIHVPYERETDDNDVATGYILFDFRQNAKIKIKKTGEMKEIKIGLYDAAGNEMHAKVWGGSMGRVRYSTRVTPMVSQKKVGIRLDFAAVQISKLAEGNSGGGTFGKIEGYVEEEGSQEAQKGFGKVPSGDGGDY